MDAAAARRADAAWGVAEPLPDPWRHGPWELERRGDELAGIRFDGSLLLRSVRAVARDRDWSTLTTEVVEAVAAGDELRLALRMTGFGGDLAGELVLRASAHELTVRLRLTSATAFARNRIGLIVLHPPRVAGSALEVSTDTGAVTRTAFPDAISPWQPAMDIAALAWSTDGVEARLAFSGDVFEMEDQRNWTDASFKTYSTPLALPFPVELAAGAEIAQDLVLTATRVAPPAAASAPDVIELSEGGLLPEFGLGVSTAPDPAAPDRVRPRATGAAFLLVELETGQANWRAAWERAVAEADGLPLDVRIVASEAAALAEAVRTVASAGASVARIGVFSPRTQVTEPELWAALRAAVAEARLDAVPVGGARSHFTELNRQHARMPGDIPALAFSSTPQMHAQERAQLVEAIPMQTLTARDAVRIAHGRPVHIGPVTLRSRYNAVATTPPPPEGPDLHDGYGAQHVPEATDPRQRSEAAAAWLVASAAAFSVEGVATVSWFETTGPRGLRDGDAAFPVEAAFAAIAELSGREALRAGATPDGVHVLAGRTPAGPVALLANLTPADRDLTVRLGDASVAVTVPSFSIARVAL